MKKIQLLLFLAGMGYHPVFSQSHTYIPFPDTNAIWVVKILNEFGQVESGLNYFFLGKDTTLNGQRYYIMTSCLDSNLTPCMDYSKWWRGIRNDTLTNKVFMCDNEGKEYLLYDFSITTGDTISSTCWRYAGQVIQSVDTILIQGKKHLVFSFVSGYAPYIEGVGSVAGLFEVPYFFEGGSELVCLMTGPDRQPYYTYGTNICQLYHYTGLEENAIPSTEIKIYPHPLTETSVVEMIIQGEWIDHLEIFDMTGKLVYESGEVESKVIPLGDKVTKSKVYVLRLTTGSGRIFIEKLLR